jgi:hypothetical protein
MAAVFTDIPWLNWWQFAHDRVLVPNCWKKMPVVSMLPDVTKVDTVPVGVE